MAKRFLFSLLLSQLTHAYESYKPKLNENCVDDIIGKICNEQCVGILVQCTIGCENDSVCISECAREEAKCIDACPCHTECFDGCEGCDHYLCNQVIIDKTFILNHLAPSFGALTFFPFVLRENLSACGRSYNDFILV